MDDILQCSIQELFYIFREGLVSLIPTADKLLLSWDEDSSHHDWENLAESLYKCCLHGPIGDKMNRIDGVHPLARYDIDQSNYERNSFIDVRSPRLINGTFAFIRMLTRYQPFDTVQVAGIDLKSYELISRLEIPFSEAQFKYLKRWQDNRIELISEIVSDD